MNLQLSPEAAAHKLQHRRTVRRSLTEWCRFVLADVGQEPARHHLKLIEALEALARGDIERLMVTMPPGSAKSTYVSTLFPPWFLAQNPTQTVIAASHTAELAERFGRRVRNLVASYTPMLGYSVASDNAAAGRWETTAGGEYFAAGVGGAITGRRADLAVIDDPVKSREDADSKLIRDKQWEWWKADFTTRLKPHARVALVMTRWHEEDLGGRVLEDAAAGGRPWHVLSLPMEAEVNDPLGRAVGEPLWPEWFTNDMRVEAKRDARTWSALYQQRPAPEEGDYFRSEWLRSYTHVPDRATLRIYGASDYAVTADGGDYTVHVVVGVDPEGRMYLLDLWRAQAASDKWVEAFCELVKEWKPIEWAEESGQIKSGVGPFLVRMQQERGAWVYRRTFPTRGDKAIRAQAIRGRMALQGLYVRTDAPWYPDFRSELLTFPAGKHDDMVDALGLIGQLLDHIQPGKAVEAPKKPVANEMIYEVRDGVLQSNMSIKQWVEMKQRQRAAG